MPQFPTYESQGQVNVPREIAAPDDGRASALKATSNLVDTVQKIGQRLSDANDVMQETKKKTTIEIGLAQQEQEAANDPNPDNVEMHLKALQDIVKNSPKIDNQEVAGRVDMEAEQSAFLSGIKIQGIFQDKKMIQNGQNVIALADVTAKNIAQAVTPTQAMQDKVNYLDTLHRQEITGLLKPEDAKAAIKELEVGTIKYKIQGNNSTDSGDYKGLTEGLDIKDSNEVQKMIDAHIKQLDVANISNTLNNRIQTIKGIANGKFSWKDADKISKIATKDSDLGEALQSVFNAESNKEPYQPENEDQNFADLANRIYSQGTKQDISDFTVSVLKAHGNKEISRDRLAILINATEQRAEGLATNKQSGDGKEDQKQNLIQNVMKSIKDFFSGYKDGSQKSSSVITNTFRNMASGQEPQQAQAQAMHSFNVKEYPWVASLPKEGAIKIDKNGNKRKIYPDGHYEDIK